MRTIRFEEFEAEPARWFDEVDDTGEPLMILREGGSFVSLTMTEFKTLGDPHRWPLPKEI